MSFLVSSSSVIFVIFVYDSTACKRVILYIYTKITKITEDEDTKKERRYLRFLFNVNNNGLIKFHARESRKLQMA